MITCKSNYIMKIMGITLSIMIAIIVIPISQLLIEFIINQKNVNGVAEYIIDSIPILGWIFSTLLIITFITMLMPTKIIIKTKSIVFSNFINSQGTNIDLCNTNVKRYDSSKSVAYLVKIERNNKIVYKWVYCMYYTNKDELIRKFDEISSI